jgi:hypothetical protein
LLGIYIGFGGRAVPPPRTTTDMRRVSLEN